MITSKIRATIKGFASTEPAVCQIGKDGLSPMVLDSIAKALKARELVKITVLQNCEEDAKYQVERDMNRQFKLLFDKYGINIPFPQVVVNQPMTFEKSSKKEVEKAGKFVEEQKEISKNLGSDTGNKI